MISIIVPIYMVDEIYLRKCIDSIRNQTYENIEIILINDGSTDQSGKIIDEYSRIDSRIKVIHKTNSGVSATRNIGIDISNGEWIMFVDSDDWLECDACENLLKVAEHNVDIIVARAVKEYKGETIYYNNNNNDKIIETDMEKKEIMNCIFLNKNTKYQTVDTPWGKLYRKQFLNDNSIKFNENLKLGEDGLLNFKTFYLSKSIRYLNKEIYHYRINPNSVCNTFNDNIIHTYIKLFECYEDILKECHFDFVDEYDYFLFRQLKNFMKKYFFSKKNSKIDEILKEELYNIVHTTRFLEAIKRLLNNNKYITIKDKILLKLVKNKKCYCLLKIYYTMHDKKLRKERIGIVTIIDNNNYGNRLQNYAVQQILREKGYNVDTLKNDPIINFKDKLIIRILKFIKRKCFYKNKSERYKNFIEFNKKIQFSKYYITPFSKIDKKYKFFICGSDQIWNPNFKRLSEVDLLAFVRENKRISFSSSFGVEKIPEEKSDFVKKEIKKFKAISVRENIGKEIIEKLSGRKDVIVMIDPTMLVDIEEWNKIIKKPKKINNNKYILNYFLGEISKDRMDEINKVAKKYNCEIINVLNKQDEFYQTGPSEFLYLEKNAFLICTDSFHACVFAILYDRPFIVFSREDSKISMNSRIETLLLKFNLEDRYYKGRITQQLLKHDYKNAYKILEKERETANIFLNNALESEENK